MLNTALHKWHIARGGRMVDFAGWDMPVQYSTITEEHHAVRKAAGLFDIGHMGRLRFSGDDAAAFLDHIVTCDVAGLQDGQIRYGLVTNEAGGILDDVLVYKFPEFHLMVVNASNRLKILDWVEEHRGGYGIHLEDLTFSHFMLALQGPKALEILNPLTNHNIADITYYWGVEEDVLNIPAILSRTGYTGEDGYEVIIPVEHGPRLWETLIERGNGLGLLPAGLGCRDTLRLEAAMPLYGHELNETIDPYAAGVGFGVKLDAADFIGKEAVTAAKANKDRRRRVGLELAGRRIAREEAKVFDGETEVGIVTSGTFSPTFEKSIAMAYVDRDKAEQGTPLEIDIRGKREQATVVKLPFYKRA